MSNRFVKHASFVVERQYPAVPERVFAAFADEKMKARWFQQPDEFDFRVGGRESNRGGEPGGPVYAFEAHYVDIVPNERIVYSYVMDMDDKRISASVTTIELKPEGGGTKLVFTEQGAFLDGYDQPEQREHGTNYLLDRLGEELLKQAQDAGTRQTADMEEPEEERTLTASRIIAAPPHLVFQAWTTPELLAEWWGPEGFTNTFHACDIRPGGSWSFTMHGPDGTDYANECVFEEIEEPNRIVLRHLSGPRFQVTGTFEETDGGTLVTFRQLFDTAKECRLVKPYAEEGNKQNLDRLEALLRRLAV